MSTISKFGDGTIRITTDVQNAINGFFEKKIVKNDDIGKEFFQGVPGERDLQKPWLYDEKVPWIGIKSSEKTAKKSKQTNLRYLNADGDTYEMIVCKNYPIKEGGELKPIRLFDPKCPEKVRKELGQRIQGTNESGMFLTKREKFSSPQEAIILLAALFLDEIPKKKLEKLGEEQRKKILELRIKIHEPKNEQELEDLKKDLFPK